MPVEIRVPQLGESVVEATVAQWLKHEGEHVANGDAVVELETEKVNIEVPAEASGVLQHIEHQEGETVRIGDVLGTLAEVGLAGASAAPPAGRAAPPPATPTPVAPVEATPAASAPTTTAEAAEDVPHHVSPVARRLAAEHGIDPSHVPGSGPGGRVTKEDVLELVEHSAANGQPAVSPAAIAAPASMSAPTTTPTPALAPSPAATPAALPARPAAPAGARREERVRLSRRRLTIARRLVEAQQTAALLTTFNEIDMTAVMEVRKRRRDSFKERHGIGLGFMSFFTKASVGALKAFPNVNAELQGEELVLKRYYDVGVAVSTEEGLVVPVVRDADSKTFAEIEREIASLATRARERKLTLEELQGGTFTITNGGVFGSLFSTPILNPPQVGILGMHKIADRPMAREGQVVIRPMMYVALTYDHRVVDGREAVSFLVRIKELIEDPETLLLEG